MTGARDPGMGSHLEIQYVDTLPSKALPPSDFLDEKNGGWEVDGKLKPHPKFLNGL